MSEMPSEAVLRWAAEAVGADARDVAVNGLRDDSRPWLLHIDHGGSTCELVLRVVMPGWIGEEFFATGAVALLVAEKHAWQRCA